MALTEQELLELSEAAKDPERQGEVFSTLVGKLNETEQLNKELAEKAESSAKNAAEASKKVIDYATALTLQNGNGQPIEQQNQPKDFEDYIMNHCTWKDVVDIMMDKKEVPNFDS